MYTLVSHRYFFGALSGQKVRLKNKKKYSLLLKGVLILSVVVFFLLVLIWSRNQIVNLGYKVSTAKDEQMRRKEINKALKLEVATLKSHEALERSIRKYGLDLAEPQQSQIYKLQ